MFNSTHTLVGFGMTRAGLGRLAPHAVWTAVVAANLPDIDGLSAFYGTASYLAVHRGITHSVAGVLLLSFCLAVVMRCVAGNFTGQFAVALLVMATHPALDFANAYGLRPLLPFVTQWVYGDVLFVIDPYIDLTLIGGLIAGRYASRHRALIMGLALTLIAGYIATRVELRNTATRQLQAFVGAMPGHAASCVTPRMLTPFTWTGIVETEDAIFNVDVDVFKGPSAAVSRMRKPAESAVIAAARNTRSAGALLAFARFPVIQTHTMSFGQRVEFIDFRFYRAGSRMSLAAVVDVNPSLEVIREEIGFTEGLNGAPSDSTDVRP